MKDKEYFNTKIFVFSNEKLKEKLKELQKATGKMQYYLIDEALREYVNKNGIKFEGRPKVPVLK